jgi:hypothetical protein
MSARRHLAQRRVQLRSGAEVQVEGSLEHCGCNMAGDGSLIIGEMGVLENRQPRVRQRGSARARGFNQKKD